MHAFGRVALLSMLLVGCSPSEGGKAAHSKVLEVNSSAAFMLTEGERQELESRVRSGDAEAAFTLASHYHEMPEKIDEAIAWFSVAAEKGHRSAMHQLAMILANRGRAGDCEQASRWAAEWAKDEPQGAESRNSSGETYLTASVARSCHS